MRAVLLLLGTLVCQGLIDGQDLSLMLSDFISQNDRVAKERVLLEITQHYPDAGPALLKIAQETKNTETRWFAIRGIGSLKYKEAVPFLRSSLHSDSNYVRANSAMALGEIHDSSAVPDLILVLKADKDCGVIEQTSMALQMLGAQDAIPVLKTRATNPSPQTRLWILGAIEGLGSQDVPFFASFLFDENEFVAAYAAHAIQRITRLDFDFPTCGETGGPCSFGYGVQNAQRWWNAHKQDWAQ